MADVQRTTIYDAYWPDGREHPSSRRRHERTLLVKAEDRYKKERNFEGENHLAANSTPEVSSNHLRPLFDRNSLEAPKRTPPESMFQDHKKVLRRFFPRDTTLLWSQPWPLSTHHFFGTIHRTRHESLACSEALDCMEAYYKVDILFLLCPTSTISFAEPLP